jgi:hypothetical protein
MRKDVGEQGDEGCSRIWEVTGDGEILLKRFVTSTVVQNVVRAIKRRRIRWVEHVASMKAVRRILQLKNLSADSRIILKFVLCKLY